MISQGLPKWHIGKNPPANTGDAGDAGSIPGSGRSPEVENATLEFLPRKLHGQRSLKGLQSTGLQRVEHDWVTENMHTHVVSQAHQQ